MNTLYLNPVVSLYANDNDAMIPEIWANMGLAILEENMVAAALVDRDFSPEVAQFGDVVNTRRPGQFKIRRKGDNDPVVGQDAITNNVRVPLDQHFYTNFTIKDGEASKSFQDLVDIHLLPGMQNIARAVDRAILGRVHGYLANTVGLLDGLTGANSRDTMLAAREKLNENKAFFNSRNLVVTPVSETAMLKASNDLFLAANKRGDDGTALNEASLGRLLGFDVWMDQNTPYARKVDLDVVDGVTDAAYSAGYAAAVDVTVTGYNTQIGEYVVVAGDQQPTYATAVTQSTGDTDTITLNQALVNNVASGAVVTVYKAAQINNAAGYAAGENKAILIDSYTSGKYPRVGQLLSIGTGASRRDYTIIESEDAGASGRSVLLDRPLELAVSDDDPVFPGPSGSLNWAFHREALALVTRPLALPASDMGVRSQVAVHNDVSMRVTMQYDISQQGTVVTLDILAGVAVLDTNLGVVMLG